MLPEEDYLNFWANQALRLNWKKPFTQVLDWELPFAHWFSDGQLNACENCLDRHVHAGKQDKKAIIWEGEKGEVRSLTYLELLQEVQHLSRLLRQSGVCPGDCVAIYMPMIPEAVIAMLACARIGATHNVVFGGFSADGLRDRILDSRCKTVITADGGFRKGKVVELKKAVDEVAEVSQVFVFRHAGNLIKMKTGRDIEWTHATQSADLLEEITSFDSKHPLFVLYTSGTTGKPKGIIHGTGGYLTQVLSTFERVFEIQEPDIYWCTADIGWITGHSYGVYGPLSAGATIFMYEGAPVYPTPGRFWEMIERHRINILYTAPTAIRMFMQSGEEWVNKHDISSLRLLGCVGEPINPEAWNWYARVIGQNKCPIVDTWWQTETGAIMIAPIPNQTKTKPGSATLPLPGIDADVIDGFLVIKKPWPSMTLGILGDPERFKQTYWSQMPGFYFTGDGAKKDEDGYFWISGRIDDVLKIAGHRIGTAEIESAATLHPAVAECATVAKPDVLKGQAAVCFVALKQDYQVTPQLEQEIMACVAEHVGVFAKPSEIRFVKQLPKTRSGKIMRRLLRELVTNGQASGDMSTLEDASVLTHAISPS